MSIDKAAILRRAAEIVEERGWKDGGWITTDGPVCILGACELACREYGIIDPEPDELDEICYDDLRDWGIHKSLEAVGCGSEVWDWNDNLPNDSLANIEISKKLVISKLLEAADMEAQAVTMPKNGCGG